MAHRQQIAAATGRDAILTGWGDWGWAGASTVAYVAADAQETSSSLTGADRWLRRLTIHRLVA